MTIFKGSGDSEVKIEFGRKLLKVQLQTRERVTAVGAEGYLMGSFHMMSQASRLSSMGSLRFTGTSAMDEMSPSPRVGRGIPPWTQNTW